MNRPEKILLIDDDAMLASALENILLGEGYKVEVATDGKSALGLIEMFRFDLIICDVIMPGTDGLETLIALRNAGQKPRVLAISGGGRLAADYYLNCAFRLGACRTLQKPFRAAEFLAAVRQALDKDNQPANSTDPVEV